MLNCTRPFGRLGEVQPQPAGLTSKKIRAIRNLGFAGWEAFKARFVCQVSQTTRTVEFS